MTPTRTTVWVDGQVLTASALNGEFNNLLNAPAIVDADIASGANIQASKILNTAVTLSDTQTLTNKTLTSPTITSPTISTPTVTNGTFTKPTVNGSTLALTTDTDGATITFDLSASNVHSVTLGGNRTLALTNGSVGQAFVIRLIQDGTGSRTVTWFSTIKWPNGVTPTLTTTASKTDVFGLLTTSAGNYDGYVLGQNL